MRLVRLLLAVALIAIGFWSWRGFAQHSSATDSTNAVTMSVAAGLLAALGGLAVWQARPHRSTGPLLAIAGTTILIGSFAWYLPGAWSLRSPSQTAAWVMWACLPLVPAHLLLAHPDGVSRRWRGEIVAVCWLVPAGLGLIMLAFADSWRPSRLFDHVYQSPTSLQLADQPTVAHAAAVARWLWIATIAVAVSAFVLRRARASHGAVRSSYLPVAWAGVGWAVVQLITMPTAVVGADHFGNNDTKVALLRLVGTVFPAVAVLALGCTVVWVELVRPRLDPSRDGRIRLSGPTLPTGEALRYELARTVGDPALRLAYAAESGGWVGTDGRPITLRNDRDRAVTTLTRASVTIAAVEHDVGLRAAPDLLAVAATMAGLAIDNDRLSALDAAQVEEARASGARLLAAGEHARHDLEMTVEQGPARRLTALAHRARGGVDAVTLQRGLREAVEEVRAIARGFAPPELIDGGLVAALLDAAEVPALRFARPIEVTAYLAAVDQPGAVVRVDGDGLVVDIPGPLAETVADRVAALDGTVTVRAERTIVTIPVRG